MKHNLWPPKFIHPLNKIHFPFDLIYSLFGEMPNTLLDIQNEPRINLKTQKWRYTQDRNQYPKMQYDFTHGRIWCCLFRHYDGFWCGRIQVLVSGMEHKVNVHGLQYCDNQFIDFFCNQDGDYIPRSHTGHHYWTFPEALHELNKLACYCKQEKLTP
jgi:hypothetical protein